MSRKADSVTMRSALAVLVLAGCCAAAARAGWVNDASGGTDPEHTSDVRPLLVLRHPGACAQAVHTGIKGRYGAWRCWVQPSVGTVLCGLWFQASRAPLSGFRCELGGNPGVGGFALRDAAGAVLWEDRWAPWAPYEAMVLEGIVEPGRIRVQLLHYDGRQLLSQSDWIAVPGAQTEAAGVLGVFTEGGVARFWDAEHTSTPLSPVTDDAPNKRRLVQGKPADWTLFGTGNWMWTDGRRQRVRQYAQTERAWALNPAIRGKDRVWRCAVRAYPGTGGAGMLFGVDATCEQGFNCWLGGTHGAGSLMLYQNGGPGKRGKALWSSPADKWHYNEELVLQAETRGSEARVQLFKADGKTLIAESPWKRPATPMPRAGEGFMAFHTWKGSVEFWGFSEDTVGPAAALVSAPPAPALGEGWAVVGAGSWQRQPAPANGLRQTGSGTSGSCLHTGIAGNKGAWRCRVVLGAETAAAGLLFQVDQKLTEGFLCLLSPTGVRLLDLAQKDVVLWQEPKVRAVPKRMYVIEGLVQTDRVVVCIYAEGGQERLAESPPIYVTDRNNERRGFLGLATRHGPAEFSGWHFEPER